MISLNILIVTLVTLIIYKLQKYLKKRKEFLKKIHHIPGPKGYPFIGNALDFKTIEDMLPRLLDYKEKYGLTYKLQLGPENYIFTADPDLIEFISTSPTQIKKSATYRFFTDWLGQGLITADNPRWKKHRKLITPTFHFNILKDFIPTFHRNAKNLIDHWNYQIGDNDKKQIDVYEDLTACTLDIICETAMGITINALKEGKRSKYKESIKQMGTMVVERTYSFWKQFDFLYNLSPSAKRDKETVSYVKGTTEEVIKRRLVELKTRNKSIDEIEESDEATSCKKHIAFLDHLMATVEQTGGSFSNEELREEVDTFIFAGHDTTSSAIGFILYCLATNPTVQQKLYEEICLIQKSETSLSYEKLLNLKYMDKVIKESLRLYPVVSIYARQLTEDVEFNGNVLPKGLNLAVFTYGAHRNEKFYPEPEKYDPERFSAENITNRHNFAYIPFSAGPRNCIGQKFAMLEMRCILAAIIKTFMLSKSPDAQIKIVPEGIIKSRNGIHLIIERRK